MRYLAVQWHQANPEYPVWLYSEIDDAGWEQRKVEVYADGTHHFAGEGRRSSRNRTRARRRAGHKRNRRGCRSFSPLEISREEFEVIWRNLAGPAA